MYLNPWRSARPRRQGQDRACAIKRPNRCFLAHGKHGGMLRRVEIQGNHLGRIRLEVRIVGGQVSCRPIRGQQQNQVDGAGRVSSPLAGSRLSLKFLAFRCGHDPHVSGGVMIRAFYMLQPTRVVDG